MTQFAPPTTARQGVRTPVSVTEPWLDVELLADRYEALARLDKELREDGPTEEADGTEEETPIADDLPF